MAILGNPMCTVLPKDIVLIVFDVDNDSTNGVRSMVELFAKALDKRAMIHEEEKEELQRIIKQSFGKWFQEPAH